jgi:spore coat polysaccharide biosynthesis predicted glycosyltransferase SpsG
VKDLLSSIIKERELDLLLVDHYSNWNDMEDVAPESFDIALIFDDSSPGSIGEIQKQMNIPKSKLMSLW